MRVVILSRNKQLHSIRRLLDEARKAKLQCDVIDPLDCQLMIDGKRSEILAHAPLPRYDVVLPRIGTSITNYGLAVVKHFENLGVPVINGSQAIAESRDKMRCLQVLSKAGVRVPPTVLTRSTRNLRSVLDTIRGIPAILKVIKGTQGRGVMILNTEVSLRSVLETMLSLEEDVLIQRFIAEGAGRDYRAFVVGDRVVAAMMRMAPKGEFRSNIHRGGEGTLVKLPKRFEKIAIRSARVLGLQVAGVDLMESKAGPVVLEVNSSPGFEGIERVTGLNIAAEIIRQMVKTGRKKKTRR